MRKLSLEKIKISFAEESDAESLAKLVAEKGFDYPTEVDFVRDRLAELMKQGDRILIAIYNAEIIGMAILHRTYFLHRFPDGRISSLVVAEDYRSFGIGSLLIKEAEKAFRQWNCGRIEVTSGAKREAAHKFYLREGFTEQPKRFVKTLPY
ncbi:MAG: GNAT family N-acetyltransferase [Pyrinomonadaceae bacterium]|nr:GNAT family N-acetyltransferase [Pyrinomonadaceae bacterium]